MAPDQKQLRLKSCVQTILDLQNALDEDYLDHKLVRKLKMMEETLSSMEMGVVSEEDMRLIEEATNRLLDEFRQVFSLVPGGGQGHSDFLH